MQLHLRLSDFGGTLTELSQLCESLKWQQPQVPSVGKPQP